MRGGESLGSAITAPCPRAAYCDLPSVLTLTGGTGASVLAMWNVYPVDNPSTTGVWVRLIDARSGTPEGPAVRMATAPAQRGLTGIYNAASGRYLVLWQDGGEVSGQLLNSRLQRVGNQFQIAAHATYVHHGELATGPAGGFLFTEVESPVGAPGQLATQIRVFATRISSEGQPVGTASWTAGDHSEPLEQAEAHIVYVPSTHCYLVAWFLFGEGGSILEDRIVDENGKPSAKVNTLVSGTEAAGTSFALAYEPSSASTRVVWLSRTQSGRTDVSLVGSVLDNNGVAEAPARSLGQLSALAAEEAVPMSNDLTLTTAVHHEIATWLQDDVLDTFVLPPTSATPVSTGRSTLPGIDGCCGFAVAPNPKTQDLVVLSTSDHGYLSQLYSSVIPVPH